MKAQLNQDQTGRILFDPEEVTNPNFEPFLEWVGAVAMFAVPQERLMITPRPHWKKWEMFTRNWPKLNLILDKIGVELEYVFSPDALAVNIDWGEVSKLWAVYDVRDKSDPIEREYIVERKEVIVSTYRVTASNPREAARIVRDAPEQATLTQGPAKDRVWVTTKGKQR